MQHHYDSVTTQTRAERSKGDLYQLKRHHNAVKRDLLRSYASESLLDIGCGRGGDIQKWRDLGLSRVHGIDLSPVSIEEARRRAAGCTLYTFDTADARIPINIGRQFHTVSTMFCLHYFFESEETLRTLLQTVSSHLMYQGHWIGCCLDSRKVQQTNTKHLTIDFTESSSNQDIFGRQYTYRLHDTVTSSGDSASVEFLVDMDKLQVIALEYGLVRVHQEPFPGHRYPGHEATEMCIRFAFIQSKKKCLI